MFRRVSLVVESDQFGIPPGRYHGFEVQSRARGGEVMVFLETRDRAVASIDVTSLLGRGVTIKPVATSKITDRPV